MPLLLELPSDLSSVYDEILNLKINENSFSLDDILKIKNLISSNENLNSFFSQMNRELNINKFLIIRGITSDTEPLIAIVSALAKEAFFCERLGGFYDEFETQGNRIKNNNLINILYLQCFFVK